MMRLKILYRWKARGSFVLLPAGMFTIFMPQDGHMPGIAVNEPQPVKKVVVEAAVADA